MFSSRQLVAEERFPIPAEDVYKRQALALGPIAEFTQMLGLG